MHLSSEVALDLIEARTEPSDKPLWSRHFENCASCRVRFQEWSTLHVQLKRTHLENAPQAVVRRAETIFKSPAVAERPTIREVFASLLFDSFSQPALAGARGGASGSRQIVLRTQGFDVHVKIWGAVPWRRISGQVLARGESTFVEGYRLHLVRDGERLDTILADAFGEFEFPEVPEGSLSVQVELPDMTLIGTINS